MTTYSLVLLFCNGVAVPSLNSTLNFKIEGVDDTLQPQKVPVETRSLGNWYIS